MVPVTTKQLMSNDSHVASNPSFADGIPNDLPGTYFANF